MIRKLIIGAYGTGNLGDEAILAGILNCSKILSDKNTNEIIVFSRNPTETIKLHGIKARRRNLSDLIKSDEIIIGGGELFQKQGNMAIKYSLLGLLAKILRKRLRFHAIGVSSDINGIGRFVMRLSLNMADKISVRDLESKKRLLDLGIYKTISVVSDPAFDLEPISHDVARILLKKEGIEVEDCIRIAVISQHVKNNELNNKIHISILEFIKDIIEKNSDLKIIFIPFTYHIDKPFDRDFLYGQWLEKRLDNERFYLLKNQYSPQQMAGIIGLMGIVVSTRMHPLILATKMNVSSIGIGLFDKTVAFCKKNKIPLIDVDEIKKLYHLVQNLNDKKRRLTP
jgi:polysaccharide pyruvyl transferase WcaK-like protein